MDKESATLFNKLVRLQPHELLATDIEFLKARQSYLSDEQKKLFAKVLATDTPKAPAQEEEGGRAAEELPEPPKSGKKK